VKNSFLNEKKIFKELQKSEQHPNIVDCLGNNENESNPEIYFKYYKDGDLYRLMRDKFE
jgi:hypothetical protein